MTTDWPSISVIIPARDEERYIEKCIDSIYNSAHSIPCHLEIVVVLNRCTDNTEEIARRRGCIITREDSRNLARIRNEGVKHARGELIITIDADSQMSKGMIAQVLKIMKNGKIVGGGVLILPERWSLGILFTYIALIPVALWYGVSAGMFFCTRRDFEAIGGFNQLLASVEDIDFAKRLKVHGKKCNQRFRTIWQSYIKTSCRKFDHFGDWYFILHPKEMIRLFKGHDQELANKIWYDFDHRE